MAKRLSFLTLTVILGMLSVSLVHAQDTPDCEPGFHLFDHELLATDPVCIPDDPQRIVALDAAAAELLLFTDKEIVGVFDTFFQDEMIASLPALTDELEALPGVGWPVNLEVLVEAAPDLIVGYQNETMPYDALSQIAPTVLISFQIGEGDWKRSTEFWSEVFGVEDLYEEMLATYDARVAELQTLLGEDREDTKVSVVLGSSYFNLIYTEASPIGGILSDVGLGRPESQALSAEEALEQYGNAGYAMLSDETFNLADGDAIFLTTFPVLGDAVAASDQYLADFQANPLWQSLSAVRDENAYPVGYAWARANTYLLANAVLDDLFRDLAHTESTIPNPIVGFAEAEATPEAG